MVQKLLSYYYLIQELSSKELRQRYYGSFFGIIWAFIHPLIMVSILWFVFQIGFRSVPIDEVPFILWLIAGMIPWFFISDALSNGVSVISDNSYLVKKVVFKIALLPIVRILSALKIHGIFLIILFIIYLSYGYTLSASNLQILYYITCSIALTTSIVYISSTLYVFFKDIGQVIALLTQLGFWLTPIFWILKMVPEKYHFVIKLNPVYYIVEGYRISLFSSEKIWDHPNLTLYFWFFIVITAFLGRFLYKKLKPHFADVL